MKDAWKKAASDYRNPPSKRKGNKPSDKKPADPAEQARKKDEFEAGVAIATEELDNFLSGEEGQAAKALLDASDRSITFYYQKGGGGGLDDYIQLGVGGFVGCDGNGKYYPTTERAVRGACLYHGKKPAEILPWLIGELDKIAGKAPK